MDYGQGQGADGLSGEAESPAPSGVQSAFVFEHRVGFFDDVASAVGLFPSERAVGDALEGVEKVYGDAGERSAAISVVFVLVWLAVVAEWDGVEVGVGW